MSLVEAVLALRTRRERILFEKSARSPARAQEQLLTRLVGRSRKTIFGQDHTFEHVHTVADYQRAVPVRDYEQLRPYVRQMLAGHQNVLTADPCIMFAMTSGSSGDPKFIPVTAAWREQLAGLNRLWMCYAARDHYGCFAGRALMVASPAIEGFTENGLPYGSMSGVSHQRIPWLVRRQFAIPYVVSLVADSDTRYFLTMRIALARSVTILGTPNSTTLLRLAETAASQSEAIIKAIHDGTLGIPTPGLMKTAPAGSIRDLQAWCRPQRARARELEALLRQHGALRPRDCWPQLKLIGCWLGGSAGIHAGRLQPWYGVAPQRDLGLFASEGRMTIPTEDGTAAGCLAVHRSFLEFIPEDRLGDRNAPILLAHELELGKRYNLIITGRNGLWRYDMNDLVEVRGFFERTPQVAFIRKGKDVLSVTGEKVHIDQIQTAVRQAERSTGLEVWQYRLVGNLDRVGHDLLVEFHDAPPSKVLEAFLYRFDLALAGLNCEYASKRKSRRLAPPRMFGMQPGWSERQCREDFRQGKREHQYKWPTIRETWDAASRREVAIEIELNGEKQCQTA